MKRLIWSRSGEKRADSLKQSPIQLIVLIVACGSYEIGSYFDATDPILNRHSRTMADAEAAMFEQTSGTGGAVFAFGEDAGTASALLPIFRDAAVAIELDFAEWRRR